MNRLGTFSSEGINGDEDIDEKCSASNHISVGQASSKTQKRQELKNVKTLGGLIRGNRMKMPPRPSFQSKDYTIAATKFTSQNAANRYSSNQEILRRQASDHDSSCIEDIDRYSNHP